LEKYLRASGVAPELALSSSAVRAVQTLEAVRPALPPNTVLKVEPDLYGGTAESLLTRLRELPDQLRSVLMVNHSPAIEGLAIGLARESNDTAFQRLRVKYPTGGFAALSFEVRWSELAWGLANLDDFVVPRELE
jgi:phosphohistidine phosphatase